MATSHYHVSSEAEQKAPMLSIENLVHVSLFKNIISRNPHLAPLITIHEFIRINTIGTREPTAIKVFN